MLESWDNAYPFVFVSTLPFPDTLGVGLQINFQVSFGINFTQPDYPQLLICKLKIFSIHFEPNIFCDYT